MQLEVEPTGITDRIPLVVPPPKSRTCRIAIGTDHTRSAIVVSLWSSFWFRWSTWCSVGHRHGTTVAIVAKKVPVTVHSVLSRCLCRTVGTFPDLTGSQQLDVVVIIRGAIWPSVSRILRRNRTIYQLKLKRNTLCINKICTISKFAIHC